MARPEPGPGRGARLILRDVTPGSRATAQVPRRHQFVSWEATSILHAHWEVCFGEAGRPRAALFGLSVDEQIQPIQPPGQRP